jgi:hypothetical protein
MAATTPGVSAPPVKTSSLKATRMIDKDIGRSLTATAP